MHKRRMHLRKEMEGNLRHSIFADAWSSMAVSDASFCICVVAYSFSMGPRHYRKKVIGQNLCLRF
jgi:hypothetical protein